MTDIMVFTPVLRLEAETVQAVISLDNSGPITLVIQRDNPSGQAWIDHLHQYQRGRDLFLNGPFDAMLVIESDVIPPKDTIKRLLTVDADIAYGVYVFRGTGGVVNILERYYPWPETGNNLGESMSIHAGLWEAAKRQGIVECSGAGLGCVLIKRHVIERFPFESVGMGFFDWAWTETVYRAGLKMKADTLVVCGHKDKDGVVLWPN